MSPRIVQRRKRFERGDEKTDKKEEDITFPLRAPIVLRDNFDRLNVISVQAQVSVDDMLDSSSSQSSSIGTSADHRFSWASSIPSSCVPLSVATTATTADMEGEVDDLAEIIGSKRLRRSMVLSPSPSVRRQRSKAEVEQGSELRLPWLWVQGWRARLQKAGDEIERARWEGRVESHLVRGTGSARKRQEPREKSDEERHEVVVKRLPAGASKAKRGVVVNAGEYVSVIEVGGEETGVQKQTRRKSVHWA